MVNAGLKKEARKAQELMSFNPFRAGLRKRMYLFLLEVDEGRVSQSDSRSARSEEASSRTSPSTTTTAATVTARRLSRVRPQGRCGAKVVQPILKAQSFLRVGKDSLGASLDAVVFAFDLHFDVSLKSRAPVVDT